MKILFSFAHPDDETFSSGGTIAKLIKDRVRVKLICATRGEAGSLGEPPSCTKEQLPQVREQELKNAAKILGISEIFFLGLADGTLHLFPLKKLEEIVLKLIKKEKPDIVITFNKTGGSNHPDHKVMSKATTNAFKVYMNQAKKHVRLYHTATPKSYLKVYERIGLAYTAFGKVRGVNDEEITTVIDISDTYNTKLKAANCHKTQHQDWERFLKRAGYVDIKKEFFQMILENKIF